MTNIDANTGFCSLIINAKNVAISATPTICNISMLAPSPTEKEKLL